MLNCWTTQLDAIKTEEDLKSWLSRSAAQIDPVWALELLVNTPLSAVLTAFKKEDKVVVTVLHNFLASPIVSVGVSARTRFFAF